MREKLAIGIDFGTTNSIAAGWGEDVRKIQPEAEAFWDTSEGRKRPHASVVWYSPDSNPIVGNTARAKMGALGSAMGHRFVRSIKRTLGDDRPHELVGGQRASGFEIAAHIFQHIRQHASNSQLLRGREIKECVVTVPVTFSGKQRKDIRRAVERAGMQLTGFLHEPFAAMISHFYDPDRKLGAARDQRILVFDWGGGTLDVCIVQVSKDGKRVVELAHGGIEDHAGDDFDHRVMAYLRTSFINRHKDLGDEELDLQGDVRDRFWLNAEAGKIELSRVQRAAVTVANFHQRDGHIFDLEENLSRGDFEELITAEVDAALRCVQRRLDTARLSAGTIDHVLLVGGTSNIPLVRERLETLFGHKVQVAHEPDAAIARGAAIVAAEGWRSFNALALGVKLCDGTLFEVLNAGVPLQASSSRRLVFYCTDWRIGSANLIFARQRVTGDREVVTLGTTLQVPTKSEVDHEEDLDRIVADFTVTSDATLHCIAQSTTLGKRVECEIHDISFGLEVS